MQGKKIISKTTFLLAFVILFVFFACEKKSKPKTIIDEYEKISQEEVLKDFIIEDDKVLKLSDKGLEKEVIYFPNQVKQIKENAISSNKVLKIVFSPNIVEIEKTAIINCPNLNSLIFYNKFKTPGLISFNNPKLENIKFINAEIKETTTCLFFNSKLNIKFDLINCPNLIYKDNQLISKEENKLKLIFLNKNFNYNKLDKDITHINHNLGLEHVSEIETIKFSDNLEEIGTNFIIKSNRLKQIYFGEKIKKISCLSFQNIPLEYLDISVKNINFYVYNNTLVRKENNEVLILTSNSNLKNNENIKTIAKFASLQNKMITIQTLDNVLSNIEKIEDFAFKGCVGIKADNLNLDNYPKLTTIGSYIFEGVSTDDLKVSKTDTSACKENWNKR